MFKFDESMYGKKVRFINAKAHKEMPRCFPEAGTIGIVVPTDITYGAWDDCDFLVQWPKGSTSNCDIWACSEDSIELVECDDVYTPETHGVVTAIRIFLVNGHKPYANLAFAFGGTTLIEWACVAEREKYAKGINGYTLMIDDRVKYRFEQYVTKRS